MSRKYTIVHGSNSATTTYEKMNGHDLLVKCDQIFLKIFAADEEYYYPMHRVHRWSWTATDEA